MMNRQKNIINKSKIFVPSLVLLLSSPALSATYDNYIEIPDEHSDRWAYNALKLPVEFGPDIRSKFHKIRKTEGEKRIEVSPGFRGYTSEEYVDHIFRLRPHHLTDASAETQTFDQLSLDKIEGSIEHLVGKNELAEALRRGQYEAPKGSSRVTNIKPGKAGLDTIAQYIRENVIHEPRTNGGKLRKHYNGAVPTITEIKKAYEEDYDIGVGLLRHRRGLLKKILAFTKTNQKYAEKQIVRLNVQIDTYFANHQVPAEQKRLSKDIKNLRAQIESQTKSIDSLVDFVERKQKELDEELNGRPDEIERLETLIALNQERLINAKRDGLSQDQKIRIREALKIAREGLKNEKNGRNRPIVIERLTSQIKRNEKEITSMERTLKNLEEQLAAKESRLEETSPEINKAMRLRAFYKILKNTMVNIRRAEDINDHTGEDNTPHAMAVARIWTDPEETDQMGKGSLEAQLFMATYALENDYDYPGKSEIDFDKIYYKGNFRYELKHRGRRKGGRVAALEHYIAAYNNRYARTGEGWFPERYSYGPEVNESEWKSNDSQTEVERQLDPTQRSTGQSAI